MRIYSNREVKKIEEVLMEIKCDECKADINSPSINHYYEVTTSHSRWGNDSVDSIKHYDFCSFNCVIKHMTKYFENDRDTDDYEIERIDKSIYRPLINEDILPF